MKHILKFMFTTKQGWITLVLPLLLFFAAGAANGVMDTLQFHYSSSVFAKFPADWQQWLDPSKSWVNKWQSESINALTGLKLQERFWGSSTWFSFTTDGWHLAKFIYQNSLLTGFTLLLVNVTGGGKIWTYLGVFILLKSLVMVGFTLFYQFIL